MGRAAAGKDSNRKIVQNHADYGKLMRRLCVAILGALQLACCDNPSSIYKVGETHIQVDRDLNEAFWYDDHTLVFTGIDNGPEPRDSSSSWTSQVGYDGLKSRIFVWSLGEEPRIYRPELRWTNSTLAVNRFLCAANGRIYYSTSPASYTDHVARWTAMTGPMGKERATTFEFNGGDRWFPSDVGLVHDTAVDRRCEQVFAPTMAGHNWHPSWRGDVLLDLGRSIVPSLRPSTAPNDGPPEPFVLRGVSGGTITPVRGINPSTISPACSVALPWDNTFVVWRCSALQGAKREIVPVWRVGLDGRSTRTEVDFTYLVADEVIPFREGYFALASGTWDEKSQVNSEGWGTYILTRAGWKKVLGEDYQFRALSPNGCLAAFATRSRVHPTILQHLSVYDLCKAARK